MHTTIYNTHETLQLGIQHLLREFGETVKWCAQATVSPNVCTTVLAQAKVWKSWTVSSNQPSTLQTLFRLLSASRGGEDLFSRFGCLYISFIWTSQLSTNIRTWDLMASQRTLPATTHWPKVKPGEALWDKPAESESNTRTKSWRWTCARWTLRRRLRIP